MAAKEGCLGGSDWRETIAAADVTVCQHFPAQPTSGFSWFRQVSAGTGRRCSNRYSYRGSPSALSRRDWRCGITSPPSGVGRGEWAVIREPRVVVGPVWDWSKSPLILVHDTITEADMVHAMRAGGTRTWKGTWKRAPENVLRWVMEGEVGSRTPLCMENGAMGGGGAPALQTDRIARATSGGVGKSHGQDGIVFESGKAQFAIPLVVEFSVFSCQCRGETDASSRGQGPDTDTFYSWNIGGGCSGLICIVPCIPRLAKCNVIASE